MKRLILFLTGIVLVLGLFGDVSAAETLVVDGGGSVCDDGTRPGSAYCTIQAAIDNASAGDTIKVAAGTYTEDVALDKNLSLLGENRDVDPAGVLDRGNESVIVGQVTITADGATVNGFKLTGSYIAAGYPQAHDITISYNILEDVEAEWGAIHLHGTAAGPTYNECDGAYVGFNTISGAQGHGIWTVGNDNVIIEHNYVQDAARIAIESLNHVGTGIIINNNVISNPGGKGINYWGGPGAVIRGNNISGSTYEAIFTDVEATVERNWIVDCNHVGIRLYPGADESIVKENVISNTGYEGIQTWAKATIEGNKIFRSFNGIQIRGSATDSVISDNLIFNSQYYGIEVLSDITAAVIEGNTITGAGYCGVTVRNTGDGSGFLINYNKFKDNGIYGVESFTASDINATNNWWGHRSGPYNLLTNPDGKGDDVSDNVDYNPWLYKGRIR